MLGTSKRVLNEMIFAGTCVELCVGQYASIHCPLTFLCRYNTVMKLLFIYVTVSVVYLMRYKRIIRVTYDKDRDTFRSELLVAMSTVCALFVHEHIKGAGYIHFMMEVRAPDTSTQSLCRRNLYRT
jgi:hypothetical protein